MGDLVDSGGKCSWGRGMRGIAKTGARNGKGRPALCAAEFVVELSSAELLLLFALYGPGPVLGVEELFRDMSLEQVEKVNRSATTSLRHRGILRLDPDGRIAAHDRVEELTRACYRPEHTLIVRVQEKGMPPRYEYAHFLGNVVVQHSQPRAGRHRLARLTGREDLESMLVSGICNGRSFPAEGSSFSMPEKALFEVRDHCRNGRGQTALDQTLHYCPQKVLAARLVEGLRGEARTHSLVVLTRGYHRDSQHVRGFSVLTSLSGIWALQSTEVMDEPWVEITPTDVDGIRHRLQDLIPRPEV